MYKRPEGQYVLSSLGEPRSAVKSGGSGFFNRYGYVQPRIRTAVGIQCDTFSRRTLNTIVSITQEYRFMGALLAPTVMLFLNPKRGWCNGRLKKRASDHFVSKSKTLSYTFHNGF